MNEETDIYIYILDQSTKVLTIITEIYVRRISNIIDAILMRRYQA